jgi:WD40 repeat protein
VRGGVPVATECAGTDNTMRLWNTANPAAPTPLSGPILGPGDFDGLSIRSDGRLFAVGAQNIVRLWQLSNPVHPTRIGPALPGAGPTASGSYVASMAFSSDGRTLAVGGTDGKIRLWDVADPSHPQEIGDPLTGDTGSVNTLVFGAGGHVLIAGDGSYAVRIWNLDAATAIQRICAATAKVLTSEQWHDYVPELPCNPPCGTSQ